ncbi:MAG: hypothetical protein U9Q72_03685 [Patescibacteria group bacterium]|nr:hypothetical protein [Patescibacteria group bacterium]
MDEKEKNQLGEMEVGNREMDLQEKFFQIVKILSGYSREDKLLILDVAREILLEGEEED